MSHDDNSAKQYFTSALTEERKELETSLTAEGANSSLVIAREREYSRQMGPGNSCKGIDGNLHMFV